MGTRLQVDTEHYAAASRLLGGVIGDEARSALFVLTRSLDDCAGMAGDDPAGSTWAGSYDAACATTLSTSQDVVNACYRLAALLEQTGFNYDAAESASTPGLVWSHPDTTSWNELTFALPAVASARGGDGLATPFGYSLVSHLVGAVWPNGHQDRLHRAAAAWSRSAALFDALADTARQATSSISLIETPESPAALTAVHAVRSHLHSLAAAHRSLAAACTEYAHQLDQTHAEVLGELESLVEWTAAIEISGGLLSVFTFGLSEMGAQAAEASRIASTAAKITELIERLSAVAMSAVAGLGATTRTVETVAFRVRALLATRACVAEVEYLRDAGMVRIARSAAPSTPVLELIASRTRWANFRTLDEHFVDHAKDFGSTSLEDYARRATEFLDRARRDGLPMKVDTDGSIRVYDPATRTFGSYTSDGLTRTFFKPTSKTYWERQKGVLQ